MFETGKREPLFPVILAYARTAIINEAFEDCLKSCERAIELSELLKDFEAAEKLHNEALATSILMEKVYEYLKNGKEVSETLRQSQIETFKKTEYKAPYYRAGFQHFGS